MVIFAGISELGFEYEYIFETFAEFKEFTFSWTQLFPNSCHKGLMVNTFEGNNNV